MNWLKRLFAKPQPLPPKNCDVCATESIKWKLIDADTFRDATERGQSMILRPPRSSSFDIKKALLGDKPPEDADWEHRVVSRQTHWIVCDKCEEAFQRAAYFTQRKRDSLKQAFGQKWK